MIRDRIKRYLPTRLDDKTILSIVSIEWCGDRRVGLPKVIDLEVVDEGKEGKEGRVIDQGTYRLVEAVSYSRKAAPVRPAPAKRPAKKTKKAR
jgi:hypothetical protein